MTRVIAGKAKGRMLKTVKCIEVRPTLDKIKGSIFNMLGDKVVESDVLDLFSGTGALGIEALSRGAGRAVFIDDDIRCIKIIKENLYGTGLDGEVIKGDVFKSIGRMGGSFDIVFADPPYNKNLAKILLLQLDKCNIIKNSSLIIVEHSKREVVEIPAGWREIKKKRYGDTVVSVFRKYE